ncbi:MAG: sulfotransferase [Bacteroidetes bacterium]|nr:sulfotransferase [Bacteroidota bacterium]
MHDFNLSELVLITGLARSGTTILLNILFNSRQFASLKYSNMPFLLMSNIWSKIHKTKASPMEERAHGDGLLINNQSPEALDEFFWKVFLNDHYIHKNYLSKHDVSDEILNEYAQYIKLICFSQGKAKYLCKNNNNLLRLSSISRLNVEKKIFLLFRHPAEHAMSLLKEHQLFSGYHQTDSFSLDFFNFLGHHEFGLNQKPFKFREQDLFPISAISNQEPDYWLHIWKNYYSYALDYFRNEVEWICFEDVCYSPGIVTAYLNQLLNPVNIQSIPERPKKSYYDFTFQNQDLLNECIAIYEQMKTLVSYN